MGRPQAPDEWRRYAEQAAKVNRNALEERTLSPDYLAHIRAALMQAARAAACWPAVWRHCEERNLGAAAG